MNEIDSGLVLGVTGGVATGKSFVSEVFAELGAVVVSADELARDVVAPGGPVLAKLVETFGENILTAAGTLDRKALASKVFQNRQARETLNALTHPAIAARSDRRLAHLRTTSAALIVYEAPLLFEAAAEGRVDAVLAIFVAPEIQLARLCRREGINRKAAEERISAHWPQHAKLAAADYVIDNSGLADETRKRVEALYDYLMRSDRVRR